MWHHNCYNLTLTLSRIVRPLYIHTSQADEFRLSRIAFREVRHPALRSRVLFLDYFGVVRLTLEVLLYIRLTRSVLTASYSSHDMRQRYSYTPASRGQSLLPLTVHRTLGRSTFTLPLPPPCTFGVVTIGLFLLLFSELNTTLAELTSLARVVGFSVSRFCLQLIFCSKIHLFSQSLLSFFL